MTPLEGKEPKFLTRKDIEWLHRSSIEEHGGAHGLRNEHGLESAIAQPQQLHAYTQADHFDIAGAYAFHLAESQAYIDGNKRVAISAATSYLELNGIDTSRLPEQKAYETMIDIASHKIRRVDVGEFLRNSLQERSPEPRKGRLSQEEIDQMIERQQSQRNERGNRDR